jgi:pimeloyl-ACP methyl ester carboxylesterase
MEETLFALLANLATRKPFFDVVITGHSFGAALATIGAMRYATANPMMRVSCHVFGCPRIGGEEWRQLVHSVANLKVFRVENASDPYVVLPSGSEWVQVGHAISIHETTSENGGSTATSSSVQFTASRFDRDRITSNNGMFDLIKCPKVNLPLGMSQSITTQGKIDHEMKSYVEKLTHSGEKWFTDFVGMNGNGVISFADNERRLLA